MFFIGQEQIMYSLGDLLPYIRETKKGVSILFRGASGYGKTELSKKCCNFLDGQNYEYCLGSRFIFNRNVWIHFIDEIHLMKEVEILYPIIDSEEFVFIFSTNFDSLLPEAFINRCQSFVFLEYSEAELIDIFKSHAKLNFSDNIIKYIIEISGRNPRVMIKTFLSNLEIHYNGKQEELLTKTDEEIINNINKIYGIEGGLDGISRQYLETLKNLGGRSNINLLASSARLDVNTVKYVIEPFLLYKKLIKITSRGRELC